jgi:hypothetical protein
MRMRFAVIVWSVVIGLASFSPTAAAAGGTSTASIVGRWQQSHTCDELVSALDALGLGALAPGVVGDYFPDLTPEELAAKSDICSGALPQLHSHFFTTTGLFGSLDQFQNQVDDDTYEVLDSNTLRIGSGTFGYKIQDDRLALTPFITDKQRREALRHPWDFSIAGWMVAVSYPGTMWNRVACQGWC